jgi:hypothetical protein
MPQGKVTYLNIILSPKEKEIIAQASAQLSLKMGSFARMVLLQQIKTMNLDEEKEGEEKNAIGNSKKV